MAATKTAVAKTAVKAGETKETAEKKSRAKRLVIVESPAKAKTIGKFLGRNYKVEASQGHVRDLPKSQLGVDIDNNFEPKYITIRGRGDIIARIRKEAKTASSVYLATDPDREGEAISWHLASILDIDQNANCRIEFNEITEKAIKAAVKSPRALNMDLIDAQQARRVLDRLVGYKLSPLLWEKVKKNLSAGRVQSVAAKMICDRENEIEEFVPEEYWTLSGDFEIGGMTLNARYSLSKLSDGEECEKIIGENEGREFTVGDISVTERRKNPMPPFITSSLQQEASRKLNFTGQKTMQIAQQLYEGVEVKGHGSVGLVSYIRTDSTRISDEALAAVRDYISDKFGGDYLPETPNIYRARRSAQDAHEAIRPTYIDFTPDSIKASLTRDQYRLYKLIFSRFVACQMTPAVYEIESADISRGDTVFHFSCRKKTFAGFTTLYEESLDDAVEEKDVRTLPALKTGMKAKCAKLTGEQHFTQPPPRYTEASLVRALEEKGIGRPSTYAPTIGLIINRGYVARDQKRLVPTELGKIVNDVMCKNFPEIVDITFTANLEEQLDKVEEGTEDWHKVIADFYSPFESSLEKAEENMEKVTLEDQVSDVKCDKCGAMMVYKISKFGRFLACPNFPACRNTLALPNRIGVKCPKCGGELLERVNRKGRKFYGCENYPECDFVDWNRPVNEKCPVCGSYMVFKKGPKDTFFHVCTNESCRHRVQVEAENE